MMSFDGTVRGGVVVLEPGAQFAEGTLVRVEPIPNEREEHGSAFNVFRMGDLAVDTGVPDLATNIDHYLYGHPKVNDAGESRLS